MGHRLRSQGFVAALTLALWSAWPQPSSWALLVAYGVALAVASLVDAPRRLRELPALLLTVLLVGLAAPGVTGLVRLYPAWLESEGLNALGARLDERMRVEELPAIAPPLVVSDRAQTFYVHATPHAEVRVRFGAGAVELHAEELGQGLYRLSYDPARDGELQPRGMFSAELTVAGQVHHRELRAVHPLAHPRWLTLSPDRALAITVSEETDELYSVSARGLERRVQVGDGPSDCLFLDAARVAVSHRDDALHVIDVASGTVLIKKSLGAGQGRMALSPDQRLLALAELGSAPRVLLLDAHTLDVLASETLDLPADWLAFAADPDTLLVSTRADASLRKLVREGTRLIERERLSLGRPVVTLARVEQGKKLLVATTDYRADGSAQRGNHFVQDQILTVQVEPLRVSASWLTARRSQRQLSPGSVDRGLSPLGISAADPHTLLVAFAGSEEVWRVVEGQAEPEIFDLAELGAYAPHSVVELVDHTLLVSSPSAGALFLIKQGQPLVPVRLAPDDAYLQRHDPDALALRFGERGFYEGTQSGISCQSCHLHADSDERAHNLGTHGLLPTLSVRGLAGTAPYLRDGSFARLADLDHVAEGLYRGYRRKAPGRAQTLEAYVSSLPRLPSRLPVDVRRVPGRSGHATPVAAPELRAGVQAFVRARCVTCHAFPAFTGLGQHLGATLFPARYAGARTDESMNESMDVPSLLSLGSTAPYLSDGRALTLEQVLGAHNRDNRHGDVRALSAHEKAALSTFLGSL